MKKKPALTKLEDGTLEISDGKTVIGALLPAGNNLYTIRMGERGGFYPQRLAFDDALNQFIVFKAAVTASQLDHIRIGANLIYKKKYKPK